MRESDAARPSLEDASRASWIAIAGLGVTLLTILFVGMPLAGALVEGNDQAGVAGFVGGGFAGVFLGGLAVGGLSRWTGLSSRHPWLVSIATPGSLLAILFSIVCVLNREWDAFEWIPLLPCVSIGGEMLSGRWFRVR
jgi:hypothetical protein